jgi:hypothetical protein
VRKKCIFKEAVLMASACILCLGSVAYVYSGEDEGATVPPVLSEIQEPFIPVKRIYELVLPPPFERTQVTFYERRDSELDRIEIASNGKLIELMGKDLDNISGLGPPEFFRVGGAAGETNASELDDFGILMEIGGGELLRMPEERYCTQKPCIRRVKNMLEITVSSDFEAVIKVHDIIQQELNLGATR